MGTNVQVRFIVGASRTTIAIGICVVLVNLLTPPAQAAVGNLCPDPFNANGIEVSNGRCAPFSQFASNLEICTYRAGVVDAHGITVNFPNGEEWCADQLSLSLASSKSICGDELGITRSSQTYCLNEYESSLALYLKNTMGASIPQEIIEAAEDTLLPANSFTCIWRDNKCVVDRESATCRSTFEVVNQSCEQFITEQHCSGAFDESTIFQCREVDQEETSTSTPIALGLAPAIYNLYNWALGVGAMLALAIIIYGGVLYSASAGNPSRIEEAKKWITSALFGLALLFSTVIILNLVNPRLTTLQDIDVAVNPEVKVGFSIIGGGGDGGAEDAACRAKALEDVNAHSSCDGFYLADRSDFRLVPGENMLARAGNFGDPYCHRKNLGTSGYKEQVQGVLVQELRNQGFCEAEVVHLTTIMMNYVIPREAPNFNPNAVRLRGDPGEEVPQCTGAWGLFQMGKSGNPEGGADDNGDVQWAQQVNFAIRRLALPNGERYWATWPAGVEKRVSCGAPTPPPLDPNPDPSRPII